MTILGSQRTSLQEELARLLEQPATGSGLPNAARIRLSDAPHVAELAQLALHLRSVPIARPDPDFRAALRIRLLQAATVRPPAPAVRRARGRLAAWRRSVNLADRKSVV